MKLRIFVATALVLVLLASLTAPALAVSGTSSNGSSAGAQYFTGDTPTPPKREDPPDELAFTGYSVVPVAVIGIGILALGFALRRRTRDLPGV